MNRIEQLKSFLELDPSDSFTRFALALEYLKSDNTHLAEELFVHIIRQEPEYVGVYYHLGKLYELKGKFELASSTYVRGIDVATTASDIHAANELREALLGISDD